MTQWTGASKCVPVCSPQEKLFQYQAGPRLSYLEISSRWNGQVLPNSGGSWMVAVAASRGWLRSTTRIAPEASALVKAVNILSFMRTSPALLVASSGLHYTQQIIEFDKSRWLLDRSGNTG